MARAAIFFLLCMISMQCSSDSRYATTDGDNTGDNGTLGVCADLIECARATGTAGVTTYIAVYGEEGTCWSQAGVTKEDCWIECSGAMEPIRLLNPDEPTCRECEVDADCLALGHIYCNESEGACTSDPCGNGIVDGDEACEPSLSEDCDDECEDSCQECHPMNSPGACDDDEFCDLGGSYDIGGVCLEAPAAPKAYGEICGTDPATYEWMDCGHGLFCSWSSLMRPEGCGAAVSMDYHQSCCTPYCDTRFPSCPDNRTCEPIFRTNDEGYFCESVRYLGYCR